MRLAMGALTAVWPVEVGWAGPALGVISPVDFAAAADPWQATVAPDVSVSGGPSRPNDGSPSQSGAPKFEIWTEADFARTSRYASAGLDYALAGSLSDDGWLIRVETGAGTYSYQGSRAIEKGIVSVPHNGTVGEGEAFAGYQKRWGPAIIKLFAGATFSMNRITPDDPDNVVDESRFGPAAGAEVWLDVTSSFWTALNADYRLPFRQQHDGAAIGYRVLPSLSIGAEARYFSDTGYSEIQTGGFLRAKTSWGNCPSTRVRSGHERESPPPTAASDCSRGFDRGAGRSKRRFGADFACDPLP
jgi:hypothetical protein